MGERALDKLDQAVVGAARGITRRKLMRNAGAAAFGASLSAAFLGGPLQRRAAADHFIGTGPCAGSPHCNEVRCTGPAGSSCDGSRPDTKWRVYASSQCESGGDDHNCWTTCNGNQLLRCCDCCVNVAGGVNNCTGCGAGQWHRCYCGGTIGNC
jgi:hypothetical protein